MACSKQYMVYSVSFSRDGTLLAVAGLFRDVQIWDTRAEEPIQIVQFESGNLCSYTAVFRAGDNSCMCSGLGGVIKTWNIANNKVIVKRERFLPIYSLCLSPDERTVAVGAYDDGLSLLDSKELEEIWNIEYKHDAIYQPTFSSDAKLLFAGSREEGIIVVEVETGSKLGSFPISGWCLGVSIAPNDTLLVSGSHDATIKFWDARPFVTPGGKPHIEMQEYTPPNLFAITDDPATWPEWWQKCKIDVPERMVPNPDFGKCLRTIEQKLNCRGLQLAGAKGLNAPAPDGEGILGEWLAARGAVWQRR